MKNIIYSVNIGNYDVFNDPIEVDKNVRYVLFTDNNNFKSKIWEVFNINKYNISHLHPRKIARILKINSHLVLPSHDVSIWIDHCFQSKIKSVEALLKSINFDKSNIMLYKHLERNCIYDEANVCIKLKLDYESVIINQIKKYREEKFPNNFGLFQTGFMIRKNNENIKKFNEVWSNEILHGSGRDQISQCYASWITKVNINPITIGKSQYNTPFLSSKNQHNKKYKF